MKINQSALRKESDKKVQSMSAQLFSSANPQTGPRKYFDLIEKVGSGGIYQRNIFLIFTAQWFVAAFFALGTSFLYLGRSFNCPREGLLVQDCYDTVCKLPERQWETFLADKEVQSLATEFGPFYCTGQSLLSSLKTANYIGTLIGYLVFAFISDNYGRKFALFCAWLTSCIGIVILVFSPNIWIASIGLLMAGGGTKGSVRTNSAIVTETVSAQKRQKYVIISQVFEGFAGVSVGIFYLLIPNWRIVTGACIGVPCLVVLIFVFLYVQQTPKFLLQKDQSVALKSLNRIAKINNSGNLVTIEQINGVIRHESEATKNSSAKYTPIDLIKYPSLRVITVSAWVIYLALTFLYLGPTLIIDSFGFSPYISQITVASSEIVGDGIMVFLIGKVPRKNAGICLFSLSALFTGILIFIEKPANCEGCFEGVIQLIFVFGSRLCTACFFSAFIVYCLELYPQSVRALGISTASAVGALAAITGPIIIGLFTIYKLNTMLLFTFWGLAGAGATLFLPETLNKPLKDQIDECLIHKQVQSPALLSQDSHPLSQPSRVEDH